MNEGRNLFNEHIARMRRIFRGEESWGDGMPAEQARRFHQETLFQEVIERARQQSPSLGGRPVHLLVSLSGFSPETTILAYELLKPVQVVIIRSTNSHQSLDRIAEHLVGQGRLRYSAFQHFEIDPSDPRAIHRVVAEHACRDRSTGQRAVIDITGGKKVMSAAAALAAWQLDLEIAYIDSIYDGELRQPVPGTEKLVLLENPMTLFGHEELRTGREIFSTGAFAHAADRFDALAARISNPNEARVLAAIARFYATWCDLDFDGLVKSRSDLLSCIQHTDFRLSSESWRRLRGQLDFTMQLVNREPSALLTSYFLLGEHYLRTGRRDFAALLFYRTIEGCLSNRDNAVGTALRANDQHRFRFAEISIQVDPRRPQVEPSDSPGLIERAVWLAAMQDPMATKAKIASVGSLQHLLHLTSVRNRSVLAHGSEAVSDKDCRALQAKARDVLRAWHDCEGAGKNIGEMLSELRFISIDNH